jgi:phage tail-like protein
MPEAAKAPQPAVAPGQFVDPYRKFNFKLLISGMTEARFMEFSGIDVRVDAIAYAEGGNTTEYYVPGRTHYDPVTLESVITQSHELWDWMMQMVKGTAPVPRKDVQILLLDSDGTTEKVRWTLYKAWPCAWEGAHLNALVSEYAIQRLRLVYERVDRQD